MCAIFSISDLVVILVARSCKFLTVIEKVIIGMSYSKYSSENSVLLHTTVIIIKKGK